MASPWTRDGTVRAYVVTIAPEVVGRIVQLPIIDNQLVHKGDLLMVIDPRDYAIAVDLAEATVTQARANADNAKREADRRAQLTNLESLGRREADLRQQRSSSRGELSAGCRETGPGPGQFGAHKYPFAGQRIRNQPARAAG